MVDWSPRGARMIVDYCSGRRAWRVCLVEAAARSPVTFEVADDNLDIRVVPVDTPERGLSLARKMIDEQTSVRGGAWGRARGGSQFTKW